jgi:peptide/nickel transport system substrate-binding protein
VKKVIIPLVLLLVCALVISGCASATTTTPPTTSAAASPTIQAPTSSPTIKPPTTTAAASPTAQPPTSAAASAKPKSGGTFRFISYTADTSPGGWPADVGVQGSLAYEGLLRQQANGDLTPWLATSWDIAQDHSSVVFHLRKGVKFTDGTDFNAAAVKFNFDAQKANKKAPDWGNIEVIDDYTLKVNIAHWGPTTMLTFGDSGTSPIASPTAYQKNGIDWIRQNPVGTGAFMLNKFTRDAETDYIKNPNYWQPGKPYLDAYNNVIITDPVTQEAAMQAKEGDATMCELGKMTADFQKMGLKVDSAVQAILTLVPDTADADSPWSNQMVREATEYAIDKDAIAASLGYGLWMAPYQIPPRGNPVWDPNLPIMRKYDVNKAKQLMAQAGYPSGFKTSIIPFPGAASKDATMAVAGYLAQIGIQAEPQFVDIGKYFAFSTDGWGNGLMFHPVPAYTWYIQTLNSIFGPVDTTLFFKKGWARSPAFTAALQAANNVTTPDVALTRAVCDLMDTEASVVPVHEGGKSYAYQSYVKDAGFLTRGFANFFNPENIWLDK